MFEAYMDDDINFDDTLRDYLVQLVEEHGENWQLISEEFKSLLAEDEQTEAALVLFSPLGLKARYLDMMREVYEEAQQDDEVE